VTAALAGYAERTDLRPPRGLSPRACRAVLRIFAKLARDDGSMRYGLRGSKAAELTDYSLSVVRRAQRWLVDEGWLVKVEVGGGRKSTKWRVNVDRLRPADGHVSRAESAPQPVSVGTAQERIRLLLGTDPGRSAPNTSRPVTTTTPPAWRPGRVEACEHGGLTGLLPDGRPRCPSCRRSRF
jgi:hypothetical protein